MTGEKNNSIGEKGPSAKNYRKKNLGSGQYMLLPKYTDEKIIAEIALLTAQKKILIEKNRQNQSTETIDSISKITDQIEALKKTGQPFKSVVSISHNEKGVTRAGGKDSLVLLYDKWAVKYSRESREVTKEVKEYYVKKYHLLKLLLGKYIPTSYFIFGQKKSANGIIKDSLITIQRRVRGNTFKELNEKGLIKGEHITSFYFYTMNVEVSINYPT